MPTLCPGTTGENNYWGKASMLEPGPERWKHVLIEAPEDEGLTTYGSETTASQARQKTKNVKSINF
ncbi:hypothetical protein IH824_10640 [candidate division KSB1 bacterium]|nr:hypothetical protein [candidate division KSB1 bacterium]